MCKASAYSWRAEGAQTQVWGATEAVAKAETLLVLRRPRVVLWIIAAAGPSGLPPLPKWLSKILFMPQGCGNKVGDV